MLAARHTAEYASLSSLSEQIARDIRRTFPALLFFRSRAVQTSLNRLLLLFALAHPALSYRQGFADLAATFFLLLFAERADRAAAAPPAFPAATVALLNRHLRFHVSTFPPFPRGAAAAALARLTALEAAEADCYALLERVGSALAGCYVEATALRSLEERVGGVVQKCRRWAEAAMKAMETAGAEPSLFLVQWLRVLLAREFPVESVWFLWDRLFLWPEPDFPLCDAAATALLLALAPRLLRCGDVGEVLETVRNGPREIDIREVWEMMQRLGAV